MPLPIRIRARQTTPPYVSRDLLYWKPEGRTFSATFSGHEKCICDSVINVSPWPYKRNRRNVHSCSVRVRLCDLWVFATFDQLYRGQRMCATMNLTALVYDCLYVLILILNSFWFLLFFSWIRCQIWISYTFRVWARTVLCMWNFRK